MNALETMQEELRKNQKEQSLCLDKYGIRVRQSRMNDYSRLVIEARVLRDGINWLKENVYHPVCQLVPDPHEPNSCQAGFNIKENV